MMVFVASLVLFWRTFVAPAAAFLMELWG
jgi:hypothetical protein